MIVRGLKPFAKSSSTGVFPEGPWFYKHDDLPASREGLLLGLSLLRCVKNAQICLRNQR